MLQGKVYLVGTGPGDAELITLKGYRLICQADVILHDHLIPLELLDLAKPTAEIIPVGKFASRHTIPQNQINKLLSEKVKDNKIVVRLKGGDPYLFGRGGEEAAACADAGVDFEVVPAPSSALAAPSYAGIPPTHRDYTSSVAIVTGHRKDDGPIEIPKAGTLIFLMGVSNIEKIIHSLIKKGWSKETKIAAIEHATCYDQRVITGTLENFLQKTQKAILRTPAVFIVGEVVRLQEKLDWFTKKPNVLVLGNYPQKYRQLGNIVHRRIIDCVPLDDYTGADSTLKNIGTFDWIVFTSPNGAKYLFERLNAMHKDARTLSNAKIAVIGKTTAQKLKEFGITADMVPKNESSAGLLEEFSKLDMKNKKVLLPQSEIASNELPDGLLNMQAVIEKVPIYKTIDRDPGPIDFDYIQKILFTSGSTVQAFVKRFGQVPQHIKSYCLGPATLARAKEHNINAQLLPSDYLQLENLPGSR
ncbi:MAG: uroporphyrinogen-III C-methyltransferase [Planctomycetota bacterium]|jgi:uroporphyrinogen III methyltransferase/synthase